MIRIPKMQDGVSINVWRAMAMDLECNAPVIATKLGSYSINGGKENGKLQ